MGLCELIKVIVGFRMFLFCYRKYIMLSCNGTFATVACNHLKDARVKDTFHFLTVDPLVDRYEALCCHA
jgi:hypothetical protein